MYQEGDHITVRAVCPLCFALCDHAVLMLWVKAGFCGRDCVGGRKFLESLWDIDDLLMKDL